MNDPDLKKKNIIVKLLHVISDIWKKKKKMQGYLLG